MGPQIHRSLTGEPHQGDLQPQHSPPHTPQSLSFTPASPRLLRTFFLSLMVRKHHNCDVSASGPSIQASDWPQHRGLLLSVHILFFPIRQRTFAEGPDPTRGSAPICPFISNIPKRVNVEILRQTRVPQPCSKPSSGFLHQKSNPNNLCPGPQAPPAQPPSALPTAMFHPTIPHRSTGWLLAINLFP